MCRRKYQRATSPTLSQASTKAALMRTKTTGIEATLASVVNHEDHAEQSAPPQYSEVWSDQPAVASRPEIASVSVETLQAKEAEPEEPIAPARSTVTEEPPRQSQAQPQTKAEAEAIYLTQPPSAPLCCCCCPVPGSKQFWKGSYRRRLQRLNSVDDGAVLIKHAIESICGVSRVHTDGVVFQRKAGAKSHAPEDQRLTISAVEHTLAVTLSAWAASQAMSSVTADSLMTRATMDQMAMHIASHSRLLPPKGLTPRV